MNQTEFWTFSVSHSHVRSHLRRNRAGDLGNMGSNTVILCVFCGESEKSTKTGNVIVMSVFMDSWRVFEGSFKAVSVRNDYKLATGTVASEKTENYKQSRESTLLFVWLERAATRRSETYSQRLWPEFSALVKSPWIFGWIRQPKWTPNPLFSF
jgi:hypothetical protein